MKTLTILVDFVVHIVDINRVVWSDIHGGLFLQKVIFMYYRNTYSEQFWPIRHQNIN